MSSFPFSCLGSQTRGIGKNCRTASIWMPTSASLPNCTISTRTNLPGDEEDQPTRQRPVFPAGIPVERAGSFVSSNFDSFIPAALVIKARREKVEEKFGPLIVGVDRLTWDRTGLRLPGAAAGLSRKSKVDAASSGQLLIEAKQDMRKRGVPSPDEADAVALCFSEPEGSGFVRDKNFYQDLLKRYEGAYV